MVTRKKPAFRRQHWYRYFRLGKTVKKKRKWRALHGGDSKMRLKERGKPAMPSIGWGAQKTEKGKVNGFISTRIENLKQLAQVEKNTHVIIGKVGKKKRLELIAEANKRGLRILNKYRKKEALPVKEKNAA